MDLRLLLIISAVFLVLSLCGTAFAENKKAPYVRIAELEIDPTQEDTFKAAAKEEIETSVRVEPGVLALYAVSEKNNPSRIKILEIYASEEAYKMHLETPHFKKYKSIATGIVKSLKLTDVIPLALIGKTSLE